MNARNRGAAGVAILLAVFFIVSCGGGESPKPPGSKAGARTPVPASEPQEPKESPADEVAVPVVMEEPEYRYDARGRRDPFRSVLDAAKSKERLADLPPLQRVEIIDMKVTAIVWGSLGPSAIIKTPDGKGYTVQPGALVGPNKGVIVKITKGSVLIQEEAVDIFGVKKTRQIELELHPQEEGKG